MNADDPLIKRCAEAIRGAYGDRLAGVVLYGSVARGDDGPESDVDLLVLLKGEFNLWEEIGRLVDAVFPLQQESDHYISSKPARADDYHRGATQFYRNVVEEAIAI